MKIPLISGEELDIGKRRPPSLRTPVSGALFLPPWDSSTLRKFEDNETPTRNVWPVEEVLKFVFPPLFQRRQYEVSTALLRAIARARGSIYLPEFLKEVRVSKSTLHLVLRKLRRMGLLKVRRTGRGLRLMLSRTFGNYLGKIADSWLSFVDEVRE